MAIRGILFDKDGTIIDYARTWVPLNREAANFAAGGDVALAAELLRAHGQDPDTDAVIMIEHLQTLDADRVQIEAPAFPWQNVRKMGEDIVATELIIPENHVIRPVDMAAMLASVGELERSERAGPAS